MDARMQRRLTDMVEERRVLEQRMADVAVASDPAESRRLGRRLAHLTPILNRYGDWQALNRELSGLRKMARDEADEELRAMAGEELGGLSARLSETEQALQLDLIPRDPDDDKNVLVEIRAGAGGEEAALFAAELMRMYLRYAERHGWKSELLSESATDIGGIKEVILMMEGDGAYSRLKYERGVHRVQRIPSTESGGRIHTSTVTVAVLPEVEEVELDINPDDLKIETMRSGGAGGQHVNKTESAVRITHLPTGIAVHSQDERSQHKNRDRAMRILRARLKERFENEQASEVAAARRAQVGTGDRSERVRTYNFPQGRVTDHRIGLTLHRLEGVLDGDLDELITALNHQAEQERLAQGIESLGS